MKFRKKPVVVEAVRWWKHGDHPAVIKTRDNGLGWIRTDRGWAVVKPGDMIITGTQGEVYPCSPKVFDEIYEAVE